MNILCRLLGHDLQQRSFTCQDGSIMFVNKCKRWGCGYTVTRVLSREDVELVQQQIALFGNAYVEIIR